jgi:hypothetical protein
MRGLYPGLSPEIYVAYIYAAHNVISSVCMYEWCRGYRLSSQRGIISPLIRFCYFTPIHMVSSMIQMEKRKGLREWLDC